MEEDEAGRTEEVEAEEEDEAIRMRREDKIAELRFTRFDLWDPRPEAESTLSLVTSIFFFEWLVQDQRMDQWVTEGMDPHIDTCVTTGKVYVYTLSIAFTILNNNAVYPMQSQPFNDDMTITTPRI
ncbi:hypothetical protein SEVIR_2G433151v4 [Setaria viridis]